MLMELQIQLLGVLVLLDKDLMEELLFIDHMPVLEVVEQVVLEAHPLKELVETELMVKHIPFQELPLTMLVVVEDMDIQTLVLLLVV